ncbi:hypothetical protein [Spirosoma flavum]|uniref:Outer membrane protein beta-barrel domain-containing protein n=1 Tax=Spirosoma flavum TaxID=2048557 RepID=A0ABW6AV57_9BACT
MIPSVTLFSSSRIKRYKYYPFLLLILVFASPKLKAQYTTKSKPIVGVKAGVFVSKYKFSQFPQRPPVQIGTGTLNQYGTSVSAFQPNYSFSVFYKNSISKATWLDLEIGVRTKGYRSQYNTPGDTLFRHAVANRFISLFATASIQVTLTQLWYVKPGVRVDALISKSTNPTFDYWVSRYTPFEFSPVLATGIILPRINIELEVNPGLMNLVVFPATYNAQSSSLRSFTAGVNVAYKLR